MDYRLTPTPPLIDGLGVAGWGVGGIEAEAAMLGQVRGEGNAIQCIECNEAGAVGKECFRR